MLTTTAAKGLGPLQEEVLVQAPLPQLLKPSDPADLPLGNPGFGDAPVRGAELNRGAENARESRENHMASPWSFPRDGA